MKQAYSGGLQIIEMNEEPETPGTTETTETETSQNVNINAERSTYISPQSKEILSLLETQEWLRNQLLQYNTQLQASKDDFTMTSDDPEILLENMKELKSGLQSANTDQKLQELILRRLQQGQTLMKYLFPVSVGAGGDSLQQTSQETEQQHIMTDLVTKQTALASEILKRHKANQEKIQKVCALKKENLELTHRVRELMFNLQKEKDVQAERLREESQDETLRDAEEAMQKVQQKIELVRCTFQSLILGSGVDWAREPDLTDIVLSLGKPLDEQL